MRIALVFALGACSFSTTVRVDGDGVPIPDDAPDEGGSEMTMPGGEPGVSMIVAAGLVEDLDASAGITLGGANVNQWNNQVGGGDNVTVSAGNVTVIPAAVNGHAALRFPGNARLVGDDTAVFCPLTGGSGLTWFAVVKPGAQDNPVRNQILGTIREGTPFSGFTGGVNTGTALPYTMMRPATTESFAQSARSTFDTWVVLAGRLSAGTGAQSAEVFFSSAVADASAAVTVPGNSMCGALVIGSERTQGTEFYTGDLARVLIYNRPLSNVELGQTGRALAMRYAITTTF